MSEQENKDAPPPYPGDAPPFAGFSATPGGAAPAYPQPAGAAPGYPPPAGAPYAAPAAYPPPAGTAYPAGTPVYAGNAPPPGRAGEVVVVHTQPTSSTVVVRAGNCPNCRAGMLMDQFTCCGILLAFFCFPFGFICCLLMRRHVCSNCGAVF